MSESSNLDPDDILSYGSRGRSQDRRDARPVREQPRAGRFGRYGDAADGATGKAAAGTLALRLDV